MHALMKATAHSTNDMTIGQWKLFLLYAILLSKIVWIKVHMLLQKHVDRVTIYQVLKLSSIHAEQMTRKEHEVNVFKQC